MILLSPPMKKLLPYLILNILISAMTMLIVLLVWNRAHPVQKQTPPAAVPTQAVSLNTPAPDSPELPPLDQTVLEVQAVIVPGDLETERVLIRNAFTEAVALQG